MQVIKRGYRGTEGIRFDAIVERIAKQCEGLHRIAKKAPVIVAQRTIDRIYNNITTTKIDEISAVVAESMKTEDPQYGKLASRICISNLHKSTPKSFSQSLEILQRFENIFDDRMYDWAMKHATIIDPWIHDENDYSYDYVGFKILENSYLQRIYPQEYDLLDENNNIVPELRSKFYIEKQEDSDLDSSSYIKYEEELKRIRTQGVIQDRMQYMLMRVAIALYWSYNPLTDSDYSYDDATNVKFSKSQQVEEVSTLPEKDQMEYDKTALEEIKRTYNMMSNMYFTHATPTLYNAMLRNQQLLSCFVLGMDDSIEGINKAIVDSSYIAKCAGGIGMWIHWIRTVGSHIKSTKGKSSGPCKILKIINESMRCWDQGGKRKGSLAIWIEMHNADIFDILRMSHKTGKDENLARDLFYGLWISDLFMERALLGEDWSLFSEDTAPGLSDCYGEEYRELYLKYEREGKAKNKVSTTEILDLICDTLRESGMPYMCFKDAVNNKSNQKNIGTIKSSNLCCEINEFSSTDEYACCTLASLNLPKFLEEDLESTYHTQIVYDYSGKNVILTTDPKQKRKPRVDPETSRCNNVAAGFNTFVNGYRINYNRMIEVVRRMTKNLDRIVDINLYPVIESKRSNMACRPLGIGVQGLADMFAMLKIPFTSEIARQINRDIFETIYYAACSESCELAELHGPYPRFRSYVRPNGTTAPDSPAAQGKLQFDLWQEFANTRNTKWKPPMPTMYKWQPLKDKIVKSGMRNSLLIAPMPTASTSSILGNCESFEPYPAMIYKKEVLAGEFVIANMHMINHLIEIKSWNEQVRNYINEHGGSLQGLTSIPDDIKALYTTVWELPQSKLMEMAADRSPFVDQAQSLNMYMKNTDNQQLFGIMYLAWMYGLKTGSYYTRTKAVTQPANFGRLKNNDKKEKEKDQKTDSNEPCESCSG